MNSDMRQDSVGLTTVQLINSPAVSALITATERFFVISAAVVCADSEGGGKDEVIC